MPRTYLTTAADIISKVRILVQDESLPYRNDDTEILGWLNDAISAAVTLVPTLFAVYGTHTCTAGARQTVINERAYALLDVVGLNPADVASLTAFNPGWQAEAQSTTISNWMRPLNDQLQFYTYPPAAADVTLPILYVEKPAEISSLSSTIPMPETYEGALVEYCVSMIESKDDEHVSMQRAQQAMVDFVGRIKGG